MATKIKTIRIESILGGQAPTTHFARADQFRASLGIDPAQPIDDADSAVSTIASGLLRPAAAQKLSGSVLNAAPLWFIPNPKDSNTYVYDALGSAYSLPADFSSLTALSDGGSLTNSIGNGGEYYDNYVYFAKNTTVARYGPLNGTAAFDGDYWVTTLAQVALGNTTYPSTKKNGLLYPNHVLRRHSDGRLYILDVTNNQGIIHFIRTTKTSVEGDTNNGSTYGALTFGYGLWPTDAASYNEGLAIGIYEGSLSGSRQERAKLAFWNTTSTNYDKIIWVEFPDTYISCTKNVGGNLYVFSGNINAQGYRVSVFLGGYSFKEIYYSETGEPPLPGAADAILKRILYGTNTTVPESDGVVMSVGLQKEALGNGVFGVMRATGANSSTTVTAVMVADNQETGFFTPIIGWTNGSGTSANGIDKQGTQYNNAVAVFWSQMFRIGRPFRVKRMRMPFAQAIAANMTLTPKIYTDDGSSNYSGDSVGIPVVNNTSFANGERYANFKISGVEGYQNLWLELRWSGSALLTVNLPIEIDIEIIDDD